MPKKRTIRKAGRPPLPKGKRKSRPVVIRLTPEEFQALDREAKKLRLTLTEAIREAIRQFTR